MITHRAISRILSAWTLTMLLSSPNPALATNGLNLMGFGAESYMMGGADLAVARDTTAMNTNPGGLAQIEKARLDLYAALGYFLDTRHADSFGNDERISDNEARLANFGYAQRIFNTRLTVGIGVFAQGGSGMNFDSLQTQFGTEDELSIMFRVARITPSAAFRVNDSLSVGASVLVTYSDFSQKVFPDTSYMDPGDPSASFFGFELKDMSTVEAGIKLGVLYRFNDRVRAGIAYTSPVPIEFEDGKMKSNMTAAGLGEVTYRDITAKGLDQPQEWGVGIGFYPNPKLLTSLELTWIDWSGAIRRSHLTAKDPDNPGAPPEIKFSQYQGWRDQYVIAVGVAYEWTDRAIFRAGYNYARNPIPDRTLNPLLAPIAEHAFMLGGGYRLSRHWRADVGVEYGPKTEVTYTNPNLPFGEDSRESVEFIGFHLMASRIW